MKNVPMRFCGYTLHHNPATIKTEFVGNIRELSSPCCAPVSEHLGNRLRRISGEGELYGANCIAQFKELQNLFESGAEGLLSLPHLPAMYAYLKELRMIAEPREDVLGYRFVFLESRPAPLDEMITKTHTTMIEGESLWNIAYRYRVSIDELVRLNPQIKYIDYLDAEERVRLC